MKLSYGGMFQDRLDGQHGLPRTVVEELAGRFAAVQDEVDSRRRLGEYGFYDLGNQAGTVSEIRRFAEGVGQAFDHVLVLGIGGSALGTRALFQAGGRRIPGILPAADGTGERRSVDRSRGAGPSSGRRPADVHFCRQGSVARRGV